MKSMSESQKLIDQPWPDQALEQVSCCPCCGGADSELAYELVQDWTFEAAPGRWAYWHCLKCSALYLNPRPNIVSIGQAYARYYTHDEGVVSLKQWFKRRLVNACFSSWYKVNLYPRFLLPDFMSLALRPLRRRLVVPFGLEALVDLPKGRLMDVGCGSGGFLQLASQLGWACSGLELDPAAARAARKFGLHIEEGSYDLLTAYPEGFDCIVCSHVLEHVHSPLDMLDKLYQALKPGGVLLLSTPNAQSQAGIFFGAHWRGLEAPRHLVIPAAPFLRDYLNAMGFKVSQRIVDGFPTIAESLSIQRRCGIEGGIEKQNVKQIRNLLGQASADNVDFIELTCVKSIKLNGPEERPL